MFKIVQLKTSSPFLFCCCFIIRYFSKQDFVEDFLDVTNGFGQKNLHQLLIAVVVVVVAEYIIITDIIPVVASAVVVVFKIGVTIVDIYCVLDGDSVDDVAVALSLACAVVVLLLSKQLT